MPDDDRPLFEKPLDDLLPADPPKPVPKEREQRVYDLPAKELVVIARYQQWMLACISLQVVLPLALFALMLGVRREGAEVAVGVIALVVTALALMSWAARFVLMMILAVRLLNPGVVVFLLFAEVLLSGSAGVLFHPFGPSFTCFAELFCFLGVAASLVVNARATSTLKRNGIRVGLLGARTADLPRVERWETTMPKLGW